MKRFIWVMGFSVIFIPSFLNGVSGEQKEIAPLKVADEISSPINCGKLVYYFPCANECFSKALFLFSKKNPELTATFICGNAGDGGKHIGYYVIFTFKKEE